LRQQFVPEETISKEEKSKTVLNLGIGDFPIKSKFAPASRRFGQKSSPRSLYRL
jgi:hypothetical protein